MDKRDIKLKIIKTLETVKAQKILHITYSMKLREDIILEHYKIYMKKLQ